jgi:hypothetical protein
MRFLAIFALLLAPATAFAFSGPVTAAEWYSVHELCRLGQTPDGTDLSKKDNDAACAERAKLEKELKANGYCFGTAEQEWAPCK